MSFAQQVQLKLFRTYPKNKTNLYKLYKEVCPSPTIRKRNNLNCLAELIAYFNDVIKDEPGYNKIAPDKVERSLYNMLFTITRVQKTHNPLNFLVEVGDKLSINDEKAMPGDFVFDSVDVEQYEEHNLEEKCYHSEECDCNTKIQVHVNENSDYDTDDELDFKPTRPNINNTEIMKYINPRKMVLRMKIKNKKLKRDLEELIDLEDSDIESDFESDDEECDHKFIVGVHDIKHCKFCGLLHEERVFITDYGGHNIATFRPLYDRKQYIEELWNTWNGVFEKQNSKLDGFILKHLLSKVPNPFTYNEIHKIYHQLFLVKNQWFSFWREIGVEQVQFTGEQIRLIYSIDIHHNVLKNKFNWENKKQLPLFYIIYKVAQLFNLPTISIPLKASISTLFKYDIKWKDICSVYKIKYIKSKIESYTFDSTQVL